MDISRFIPVAGAFIAALIGIIDFIVFLWGLPVDWIKKRFQEAVKEAVEEATAEAFEKGLRCRTTGQRLRRQRKLNGRQWNRIMLLSDWYAQWKEKRIQAAVEEARAKAYDEGLRCREIGET